MKSSASLLLSLFVLSFACSANSAPVAPPPSAPPPDSAAAAAPGGPSSGIVLRDPVAEVEGEKISREDLESTFTKLLASRGKTMADFTDDQKMQGYRAVLNQMILQKLVMKRSAAIPVTDNEVEIGFAQIRSRFPSEAEMNVQMQKSGETVDSVKKGIRTSIQQKKWVEMQIGDKGAVTDADAQSYYDKNPDQFKTPETQVRASHILIAVPADASADVTAAKLKAAQAALDRVKKGEDFAKVAKDVSDDPGSKANGGDLDFFSKQQMVPEFSEAAFKLKKGEIAGPYKDAVRVPHYQGHGQERGGRGAHLPRSEGKAAGIPGQAETAERGGDAPRRIAGEGRCENLSAGISRCAAFRAVARTLMGCALRELKGLSVTVNKVVHRPHLEAPPERPYPFEYHITIHNQSPEIVTIKGRKWVVTDAVGGRIVVEGDGVVGKFPRLAPGESFSYHSYHVIASNSVAEGAFIGISSEGTPVLARIPKFELKIPV